MPLIIFQLEPTTHLESKIHVQQQLVAPLLRAVVVRARNVLQLLVILVQLQEILIYP